MCLFLMGQIERLQLTVPVPFSLGRERRKGKCDCWCKGASEAGTGFLVFTFIPAIGGLEGSLQWTLKMWGCSWKLSFEVLFLFFLFYYFFFIFAFSCQVNMLQCLLLTKEKKKKLNTKPECHFQMLNLFCSKLLKIFTGASFPLSSGLSFPFFFFLPSL